jgi:hypothetical protein
MVSTTQMPIGNRVGDPIRPGDVTTTVGNQAPPDWKDDAAATLVWQDYQQAKNYVENNSWLLEWQHSDILYQSPTLDRYPRVEQGRPPRISRYLVAKNTRTMATQVKRALFAEQQPFMLRPIGQQTQQIIDAWTALLLQLLKRMKFKYHASLLIDSQVLQGTGMGKLGWDTKTRTVMHRKRKKASPKVQMPLGNDANVTTEETDEFEPDPQEVTDSYPFFEYRRLGTTLPDPKWCTPNDIGESAAYTIDVDYVTFADLQEMAQLSCYKNIPSDETLKAWFILNASGSAPSGSQIEDSMTAQGSAVTHAEGRNRQASADPLLKPLLLIERWDCETVKTVVSYEGRHLLIRNDDHDLGMDPHVAANWWSIDNCGYGMGIGRLDGPDQRINQGVTNESLKMLAYPMNAPIIYDRGINAPTQNVIQRFGGFWPLDLPAGGDVRRAIGYLETPPVPADAYKWLQLSQQSADVISGADKAMMQGNIGSPGSSAARTATGANRVANKADDTIADPVDAVAEGVIVPTILFLIKMVKEKMPVEEIRRILRRDKAQIILKAIEEEQFLDAEFEVDVLAGQRLAAKAGIQQLIPFLLQVVQQPQLLEYEHQKGKTIDLDNILDIFLQVSELAQEPDIFRDMTPKELQQYQQNNPGAQKVQGAQALEQAKTQGKITQIQTKGQVDLANKAAEMAMEKTGEGIPLERAEGLVERGQDEKILQQGL